jgi:hypothetical protein
MWGDCGSRPGLPHSLWLESAVLLLGRVLVVRSNRSSYGSGNFYGEGLPFGLARWADVVPVPGGQDPRAVGCPAGAGRCGNSKGLKELWVLSAKACEMRSMLSLPLHPAHVESRLKMLLVMSCERGLLVKPPLVRLDQVGSLRAQWWGGAAAATSPSWGGMK